jgi:hypothetical protein
MVYAVFGGDNTIQLYPIYPDGTVRRDGRMAAPGMFKDFVRLSEIPQREDFDPPARNGNGRHVYALYVCPEGREVKYRSQTGRRHLQVANGRRVGPRHRADRRPRVPPIRRDSGGCSIPPQVFRHDPNGSGHIEFPAQAERKPRVGTASTTREIVGIN